MTVTIRDINRTIDILYSCAISNTRYKSYVSYQNFRDTLPVTVVDISESEYYKICELVEIMPVDIFKSNMITINKSTNNVECNVNDWYRLLTDNKNNEIETIYLFFRAYKNIVHGYNYLFLDRLKFTYPVACVDTYLNEYFLSDTKRNMLNELSSIRINALYLSEVFKLDISKFDNIINTWVPGEPMPTILLNLTNYMNSLISDISRQTPLNGVTKTIISTYDTDHIRTSFELISDEHNVSEYLYLFNTDNYPILDLILKYNMDKTDIGALIDQLYPVDTDNIIGEEL